METAAHRRIATWQEAERNAAAWMRRWGYVDAHVLPPGADRGFDIRATGGVAQVTFQGAPIGRRLLQQLVGAQVAPADQMFVFTGTTYSMHAIVYADQRNIALFQYDTWGRMKAMNVVAAEVEAGRRRPLLDRPADRRRSIFGYPGRDRLVRNGAAGLAACLLLGSAILSVIGGEPATPTGGSWWQEPLTWLLACILAIVLLAVATTRHSRLKRSVVSHALPPASPGTDPTPHPLRVVPTTSAVQPKRS